MTCEASKSLITCWNWARLALSRTGSERERFTKHQRWVGVHNEGRMGGNSTATNQASSGSTSSITHAATNYASSF